MFGPPTPKLLAELAGMSAADLAANIGALWLVGPNVHRAARLESLAGLVRRGAAAGAESLSAAALRRLCNGPLSEWAGMGDDPWEFPLVEAVTFDGGTSRIIPGGRDTAFVLRQVAAVWTNSPPMPGAFARPAQRLLQAVLAISETLARKASLPRNVAPPSGTGAVEVPKQSELNRLRAAVTFTDAEFEQLLHLTGATNELLGPLVLAAGAAPSTLGEPLLRTNRHVIVVEPHRLAECTLAVLAAMAIQHGCAEAAADTFHTALELTLRDAAVRLGLEVVRAGRDPAQPTLLSSTHSWSCDRDKIVQFVVVSDRLLRPTGRPFDEWSPEKIEQVVRPARAELEAKGMKVQTVVLLQGPARVGDVRLDLEGLGERPLFFSVADLETISLDPQRKPDPLLLWKFARTARHQEITGGIISFSDADTLELWRTNGNTFRRPEDPTEVGISVATNFAEAARSRVSQFYDAHSLPSATKGHIREVVRSAEHQQTVFIPRHWPTSEPPPLVVHQPPLTTWVRVSGAPVAGVDRLQFTRAVAFWVAEFAEAAGTADVPTGHPSVIDISFVATESWVDIALDSEATTPGFTATADPSQRLVRLELHPDFLRRYKDGLNTAEADMAETVFRALLAASGVDERRAEALMTGLRERVAPVGIKRMLHRVDPRLRPEHLSGNRRPPRHVQSADFSEVRRRTAIALGETLPLGPTSTTTLINQAVNSAVANHFRYFEGVAAGLDKTDALEHLLTESELLLAEEASLDLTLGPQLACYENHAELRARLRESMPEHVRSSMALRFCIEYFAALPKGGPSLLTLSVFDELMSVAAEIITLGTASDVAKYQLAELTLHVHPSGYELRNGKYDDAMRVAQAHLAADRIRDAEDRDSGTSGPPANPDLAASLDFASRAEWGVPFTAISNTVGWAQELALGLKQTVVRIPVEDFVRKAAAQLPVAATDVQTVLDCLTLRPRPAFLKPQRPYAAADVYPWRFNRELSLIRRPFVEAETTPGRRELLFTPGFIRRGVRNLAALVFEGRIKATSVEMKRFVSDVLGRSSAAFEKTVAETLRRTGLDVRERVLKVAGRRIEANGEDLGDIDVLVAEPYRKRLWLLECKDFVTARRPNEIRNDLEELFLGRGERRSVADKHRRRAEWVRANLADTLDWLDLSKAGKWTVHEAFVFSSFLISPLLTTSPFPIWTLDDVNDGIPTRRSRIVR